MLDSMFRDNPVMVHRDCVMDDYELSLRIFLYDLEIFNHLDIAES